jgi:hypothetical protein
MVRRHGQLGSVIFAYPHRGGNPAQANASKKEIIEYSNEV